MNSRHKYLLAVLLLLGAAALALSTQGSGAKAKPPLLVTLRSSGDVLEASGPVGSISSSEDDRTLYLSDARTGESEAYGDAPDGSLRALGKVSGPIRGPRESSAGVGQDSKLTVWDAAGKVAANFATYPAASLAFLGNGSVVVASPVGGRLLHVYSPTGQLLKSFGVVKQYDTTNAAQNRFLHNGKVLVDKAGNIYYVYRYVPLIQKFSPEGALQYEVEVQGAAVDIQQEVAQRFLGNKSPELVGGIDIINSAAIERKTGHLWISMNGSSLTGVVYEYSAQGEKLREYALEVNSSSTPRQKIIGAKDIAVTGSRIYVLTSSSQVYSFGKGDGLPARVGRAKPSARWPRLAFMSAAWSLPFDNFEPPAQSTCGADQTWGECKFVCPGRVCNNGTPTPTSSNGATVDCKAALMATLAPGYVVKSANCMQYAPGTQMHMRGGCRSDVTICKDNVDTNHNGTLDCVAPSCETSGGGGGVGGECFGGEFVACPGGGVRQPWPSCRCTTANSPVLVDVTGNGFSLTDAAGGVSFDLDGEGGREGLSWTAPGSDDAWLALDRNGNGAIDDGTELFGNYTPQPEPPAGEERNGFLALAEYDKPANGGNGDGVIDRRDTIFSSLRLWQDTNHNGISEAGESHPLPELGIAVLDLKYKESKRADQYGNQFRYRAKVKDAHGAQVGRWAWDVFLLSAP